MKQKSNESKTQVNHQSSLLTDPNLQRAVERLHSSGDLKKVLTSMTNEYIQAMRQSNPDEQTLREELYHKIATLDDLQSWVEHYGTKR